MYVMNVFHKHTITFSAHISVYIHFSIKMCQKRWQNLNKTVNAKVHYLLLPNTSVVLNEVI